MINRQNLFRVALLLLGAVLLIVTVLPVSAAVRPYINVSPVWHPGTTLDSIDPNGDGTADPGDDIRYVDVEIYLQGNVQFWAADVTCTVNKAVLALDSPSVTWGNIWGTLGVDYTQVTNETAFATYGRINLTGSRMGSVAPLGLNGQDYTLLMATLHFRVLDIASNSSSSISCSPSSFLNRDGNSVVRGGSTRAPALSVLTGYTVTGNVTLQGSRVNSNISVDCTFDPDSAATPLAVVITDSRGSFKLLEDSVRRLGDYECTFYANVLDINPANQTAEPYLAGTTRFNLSSAAYNLLPVMLKSGNVERGTTATTINFANDISTITLATWDVSTGAPYTGGDANGDSKVNEIDLAIAAGNLDLDETSLTYDHMIYGLATDYESPFPNSRVWYGDPSAGAVTSLVSSTTPNFWPTLSPDGTQVALINYDTRGQYYILSTASLSRLPARASTLTPRRGFTKDAFAPSWSPDGQRIAFICNEKIAVGSGFADWQDWNYNAGDVCVIDADGRNLFQLTKTDGTEKAKIYPPAWLGTNVLIFAGHPGAIGGSIEANAVCPNTLCYYDFSTGALGAVSITGGLPAGANDMPVVRGIDTDSNGAADQQWLFYRNVNTIRVAADVTYDAAGSPIITVSGTGTHENVTTDGSTAISTQVDYYNVSPLLNIVFYKNSTDTLFYNSAYTTTAYRWADPATTGHSPDGYVGNPSWDNNLNSATDLHALRAVAEWLP